MNKIIKCMLSLLKIGVIGFGGGSALIPVIEKEFIDDQKLDTKENIDKDVIVASITPGALPVEIAASLGRRSFGSKGMVLGASAMALPGALITVLMLTILSVVESGLLSMIETLSVGVSVFIVYLLILYVVKMLKECQAESQDRFLKALVLMGVVFTLVCEKNIYKLCGLDRTPFFGISTVNILIIAFFCMFYSRGKYTLPHVVIMILVGGAYLLEHGKVHVIDNFYVARGTEVVMIGLSIWGLVRNMKEENWKYEKNGGKILRDMIMWAVIMVVCCLPAIIMSPGAWEFIGRGFLSGIMSFGGGDAYLSIADGMFVESGLVTPDQYYTQIVSMVNVLPGSILCKTLSGVGYCVGYNLTENVWAGIAFALAGFTCSTASSCMFFMLIYHMYDSLVSLQPIKMISRWIRPIIAGFLLNIALSLVNQSINVMGKYHVAGPFTVFGLLLLLGLDVLLIVKCKINMVWVLLLNIVTVLGISYLIL